MPSSAPAEASSSSAGSSGAMAKRRPAPQRDDLDADHREAPSAVPLERLVEYLMEAKRSLASMHQLVQAGNMVARATDYHERAVKLSADGSFLYWGLVSLVQQLDAMKRGFIRTYENQKKKFDDNIHLLDVSVGRLTGILDRLENTPVDPVFRPEGEESKNLKDFVDEANVHNLINALKGCINELKVRCSILLLPASWLPPSCSATHAHTHRLASLCMTAHLQAPDPLATLARFHNLSPISSRRASSVAASPLSPVVMAPCPLVVWLDVHFCSRTRNYFASDTSLNAYSPLSTRCATSGACLVLARQCASMTAQHNRRWAWTPHPQVCNMHHIPVAPIVPSASSIFQ